MKSGQIIISNNMTTDKLAIKLPDSERRFVRNLPEAKGNLISNFPLVMLFVCNIMITDENSKKFAAEKNLAV
jgi:hypothetical protein